MDGREQRSWRIGELANASGLSVRALRHYDELGVLRPSARSEAGYRIYDDRDVRRLYRVVALRQLGFPLLEISSLLEDGGLDLAETARRHLHRVEQELEIRERVRRRLAPMVQALARCEQPSVDDFLAATEVASVDLSEDQWSELFHPDTLYFDQPALDGQHSDRDVELQLCLLGLTGSGDVLDGPCGWGRHANRLAARGLRVVGVDNDPRVLEHA
ncbi:MAG: MerR family transcriptional regulator, partial [Actinomycetota bacterium]|nr:MerR family transcriptional regulator [Actinomycetota bacterium]